MPSTVDSTQRCAVVLTAEQRTAGLTTLANLAPDALLPPVQVAAITGRDLHWLAAARQSHDGPPHVMQGAQVRYQVSALRDWVQRMQME
jgi:hypothetical protein